MQQHNIVLNILQIAEQSLSVVSATRSARHQQFFFPSFIVWLQTCKSTWHAGCRLILSWTMRLRLVKIQAFLVLRLSVACLFEWYPWNSLHLIVWNTGYDRCSDPSAWRREPSYWTCRVFSFGCCWCANRICWGRWFVQINPSGDSWPW